MKSSVSDIRQAPRKVRLVADAVRGKNVMEACKNLSLLNKKSSIAIRKLIESAVSNAKNKNIQFTEKLTVKSIIVDAGRTLKRQIPRAKGRATPIMKRTSRISLELGEEKEN